MNTGDLFVISVSFAYDLLSCGENFLDQLPSVVKQNKCNPFDTHLKIASLRNSCCTILRAIVLALSSQLRSMHSAKMNFSHDHFLNCTSLLYNNWISN